LLVVKAEAEKKTSLESHAGFLENLLQLLFPERCLLCRRLLATASARPLCLNCDSSAWPVGVVCPCCGTFGQSKTPQCGCRQSDYPLQGLFALSFYEGRWRALLHDLKYRGRRSLARPLGRWLARELLLQGCFQPHVVVPVPLHRNRERERGFNQSALLARQVAKELSIPFASLLIRKRETESQTKISRRERLLNVRGAFFCSPEIEAGTKILLIDDIFSTGATMSEAAKCLRLNGAIVYGAVVAFNPPRQSS
jgi:competence protein ComFC